MDQQSILHMGNLLMVQERERFLSRLLAHQRVDSLDTFRVFEAGCSTGYNLRLFLQWGARPENLAGIDIDPAAVDYCRAHSPEIRVHQGSADTIPEPDERFDLSIAFTLFSSVPDEDIAHGIAREMFRITRPGGLILVYDMRRRNPRNAKVHPISVEDLRRWFPKCPVRVQSITLAPPIARALGRYAPWLYGPAAIPPLRSHAMYVLRRPALPPTFAVAPPAP
ncbi:MAG TPA: class I SAM-dependent methyltransferase [Tepidiformaceae bacterium]|nr:class I SAM-dependent methyltransferase [Tepidiformaceae bacterium]